MQAHIRMTSGNLTGQVLALGRDIGRTEAEINVTTGMAEWYSPPPVHPMAKKAPAPVPLTAAAEIPADAPPTDVSPTDVPPAMTDEAGETSASHEVVVQAAPKPEPAPEPEPAPKPAPKPAPEPEPAPEPKARGKRRKR